MKPRPKVEVLLATFNGERFLREQIDSILSQTYIPLSVLARDDGSSDSTPMILQEYAARFPERFSVLPCEVPARSAQGNFLRLLQAAGEGPVAFSDQDDVWLPEKMEREMQLLSKLEQKHGETEPALVFSDLRVVSEDLTLLAPSFWKKQNIAPENIFRLHRLLAQNVVTGCTVLMNAPLAALARRMPPQAYMHDWWVALVANLFGHAAFVREPMVLYRQHRTNVLGAMHPPVRGIPQWRKHSERRRRWDWSVRLAELLLSEFGNQLRAADRGVIMALLRCEQQPSRWMRVITFLRRRFFVRGVRANLAMLWYLWDMNFAKRIEP